MTTNLSKDSDLPELPEPGSYCTHADSHEYDVFDAAQMRDYARKAIAAQTAVQQPILYQRRMRPKWREEGMGWSGWEDCSKESVEDIKRLPGVSEEDWQYETRALYAAPPTQAIAVEATRITLTGHQIAQLLDLAAPDRAADADQLDSEMTLFIGGDDSHSGKGLYAYWTDYPEEGAVAMFPTTEVPE